MLSTSALRKIEQHAVNLKKLIEEKDYAGLEAYLIANKPQRDSWEYTLREYKDITLINVATKLRDEKAVDILIRQNADYFKNDEGKSLTSEDRLYLEKFYDEVKNYKKQELVRFGILSGSLEEIKYWHERGLFTTLTRYFCPHDPLTYCCMAGYNDCIEYLISKVEFNVNQETIYHEFYTPLKAALYHSRISTAELLVKLGANVHMEINDNTLEKTITKRSLIHHLCLIQKLADAENEIKTRLEGMKWALSQGVDYDKNTPMSDDYTEINLPQAPALVLACRNKAPEFVELLIENQRDKWMNNGGPLLEVIPLIKDYKISSERLASLVQIILPFVNPDKKDEHLANALAAAILHEDEMYENYLLSLGADLIHVTKKDKYAVHKGRTFDVRMKLSRNCVDFLIEKNEVSEYLLACVEIPTKTAKIENIRKKMKNIQQNSEIFFEYQGVGRSEQEYNDTWEKIRSKQMGARPISRILLLDRTSHKIYNGVPELVDLVMDLKSHAHSGKMFCRDGGRRFDVFVQTTEEDEGNLSLPDGYRILFKPISFDDADLSLYDLQSIIKKKREDANKEIAIKVAEYWAEQANTSTGPRRSKRAPKRKIDQVESNEEQATEGNKRRKTGK